MKMTKVVIKKLGPPFVLLVLFVSFTLLSKDLLLQFGSEAIGQSQKVLVYVIQIGIWLSAAHFINRLMIVFFWDGLVRRTIGAPVPRLLKDVLTIILYIIAVTGIVGVVFKKSVTGFWATSGLIGLVLGFALRNIILDVFTGIAINIDRPYKIGDWIKVHGSSPEQHIIGKIIEINWRTTRIYTEDDSVVVLPNNLLGTLVVTNFWGAGPESRFETAVCLDFSVPTERACRVLLAGAKAAAGQKGILEQPEPRVVVNCTNSLGVEYMVRYWMSPWMDGITEGVARSHVTANILEHLKQAGITPAYPKQDLFYAEMPTRHLDSKSLEDRTELLGRTELFQYLELSELRQLAANMKERRFNKGHKLIKQGEAGDSMFILSEGLLHAFLSTNNNETEVRVGQIVPGEFFGEMSLLTGELRSATVVAVTDVIAHEITKDNMKALFSKRPEIAETISKVVAERRVRNSQAMATATPEERIEKTESLARQIMSKMKSFFKGVFEKREAVSA
jgi:small-conductance mechanosensitive channel/CRP-like cAMP-binding protein